MPNWCDNDITFFVEKDEHVPKLEALYKRFKNWHNEILAKRGKGAEEHSHISVLMEKEFPERKGWSRAWFEYLYDFDKEERQFSINVQSAWRPCIAEFEEWIQVYDPDGDIEIVVFAEEPGCEIYVNTDVERSIYPEQYRMEHILEAEKEYGIDIPMAYWNSLNDVRELLGELLKTDTSKMSFDEVKDAYKANYGVELHEFQNSYV